MQATAGLIGAGTTARAVSRKQSRRIASQEAVEEINAYIAIRDNLLAEAEELRTRAKIDSLCVANDYVATCLRPARSPYEAQCLPAADAARERQRCEAVKFRIAKLRALAA